MKETILPLLISFVSFAVLLSASGASTSDGDNPLSAFPAAALTNRHLRIRFYLPDPERGYYRGTRFEWSGMISTVESRGHSFFCEFRRTHDPLNHDDVAGTAEEFDITGPASYGLAKAGEPFLKIGVGLLERPDASAYSFTKPYKILNSGRWTFEQREGTATFRQVLKDAGKWAYEYTKRIELNDERPELTIRRELRNTGMVPLTTEHYGHNFLKIDDLPAGPGYRLEFPFDVRLGDNAQTQSCLEVLGNRIDFLREVPEHKSIWTALLGFSGLKHNRLEIQNTRSGASVEIAGDRALARLAFYSSDGVLCPEPFVRLSLQPGEVVEWYTTYRFEVEDK